MMRPLRAKSFDLAPVKVLVLFKKQISSWISMNRMGMVASEMLKTVELIYVQISP